MTLVLDPALGTFLRERRGRLDPAALGFDATRRRTPGLRREEVAQRAHISATWYTWLEQGRGGAPSADVLNRISRALMLTDAEREHMFMLGLGRPPEPTYRPIDSIEPRLQRVLDALPNSPALIKTATWDIIAWNRAATVVFTDYARLPQRERNLMRLLFQAREARHNVDAWEDLARFAVAAFRADSAKAGANANISELVDELTATSPEFARLWSTNDVTADRGRFKRIKHPRFGVIELEGSIFAVDGRPDLSLVVHNPVSEKDCARIKRLLEHEP